MSVRVDNSFIYKYLNEQHSRDVARTRAEEIKNKRREIPVLATKFAGVGFILLCLGLAIYLGNSFKKITENSFNNGPAQMYGSNNEEPVNGEDDLIDISPLLKPPPDKTETNASNEENTSQENNASSNSPQQEITPPNKTETNASNEENTSQENNASSNSPQQENTPPEMPEEENEIPEELINEIPPMDEENSVRNYVIFDHIEFDNPEIDKVSIGRKYEDPTSNPVSLWCYVEKATDEGFSNRIDLIGIFDGIRTENELNEETALNFGVSLNTLIGAKKLCNI